MEHPEEFQRTHVVRLPDGRSYHSFIPANEHRPLPLVLVLHGLHLSAERIASDSRFTSYAAAHQFVVAYGIGQQAAWNAGACCAGASADDVRYLTDVVADVEHRVSIDRRRVYVAGFSNGGMMALRVLCARPDIFAAAAVMSGDLLTPCAPLPPQKAVALHVRQLNGLNDETVPANGGQSAFLNIQLPDVRNEAALLPPHSQLSLTLLPGLDHHWATLTNSSVDATDDFWRFFAQHPL